jgi:hypothetical protein
MGKSLGNGDRWDLESRRELYNGFGDAMVRGIEYVGTPFLFAFMGFGLDRWLGVTPLLTIAMTLFAVSGTAVRAYYSYSAAMAKHEAERPWARIPTDIAPSTEADRKSTRLNSSHNR